MIESQAKALIFRSVLCAMSQPGRIVDFNFQMPSPPKGLSSEIATLLLTLCDFQTPIWMKSSTPEIDKYIKFHTAAPITTRKKNAAFAVVSGPDVDFSLSGFAQGTHEYPDRSTTILVQVDHLQDKGNIYLTGPGIAETQTFNAKNVSKNFWPDVIANHANYPLGVDLIFVAAMKLAALPRSTHVKIKEQL